MATPPTNELEPMIQMTFRDSESGATGFVEDVAAAIHGAAKIIRGSE